MPYGMRKVRKGVVTKYIIKKQKSIFKVCYKKQCEKNR